MNPRFGALQALKGDAHLVERYLRKKHSIDQNIVAGTIDDFMVSACVTHVQ